MRRTRLAFVKLGPRHGFERSVVVQGFDRSRLSASENLGNLNLDRLARLGRAVQINLTNLGRPFLGGFVFIPVGLILKRGVIIPVGLISVGPGVLYHLNYVGPGLSRVDLILG